ncbi:CLUMA_CG019411, isoform A [Clunio marinus]|uniref:CLUMA_CG019411, isoform A n=1 Tax=Clunio marinus TaxID=568069 RepID=A0A1J1J062_9DIPT|nr:CLUMA_CG019411, isoform A [Clunio marinus]
MGVIIMTFVGYQKKFCLEKVKIVTKMSSQQRARLPQTPNNPTTTAANNPRFQNIDVQNNTISSVSGATDAFTTNSQMYNNNNINNDDTLNALGPDLAISTSQVLDNLTDHERSIILDVLSRDESIRQRETARIL